MKVDVKPGKYVLALSGGVDSMTLLDLLSNLEGVDLVLAHFNHGIRPKAGADEAFVANYSSQLGLPLEIGYGDLGADASEEEARLARYEFLEDVQQRHEAEAIITAHHQDDLIETAIINILRGTGPQGLVAMSSNPNIVRPMLAINKRAILDYARKNGITWVEDESNDDLSYLRNYIRAKVMSKLGKAERKQILAGIKKINDSQSESAALADYIAGYVFIDGDTLDRHSFIFLPDPVAKEILARWLRQKKIPADRKTINRLAVAVKTARPHTKHKISKGFSLEMDAATAHLSNR